MCKTQDTVVSSSGVAKMHAWQGPDPPKYLLCPITQFAKERDTLLELSNILLKQSIDNLLCKYIVTPAL